MRDFCCTLPVSFLLCNGVEFECTCMPWISVTLDSYSGGHDSNDMSLSSDAVQALGFLIAGSSDNIRWVEAISCHESFISVIEKHARVITSLCYWHHRVCLYWDVSYLCIIPMIAVDTCWDSNGEHPAVVIVLWWYVLFLFTSGIVQQNNSVGNYVWLNYIDPWKSCMNWHCYSRINSEVDTLRWPLSSVVLHA